MIKQMLKQEYKFTFQISNKLLPSGMYYAWDYKNRKLNEPHIWHETCLLSERFEIFIEIHYLETGWAGNVAQTYGCKYME